MERSRNEEFDPRDVVAMPETYHIPLESLVQANEELADMYSHTLRGVFQPGEHRDSIAWDVRPSKDLAGS
jgi:hypothetical protein